jgi:hypothetical protein
MFIKCYFVKHLCLHFFGSVCCVKSATQLKMLRKVVNYSAIVPDKEK